MKRRHSLTLCMTGFLEAGAVIAMCAFLGDPVNAANVERIHNGMTEADVVKILGSPTRPRKWADPVVMAIPGLPGANFDGGTPDFEEPPQYPIVLLHSSMQWDRTGSSVVVCFDEQGTVVFVHTCLRNYLKSVRRLPAGTCDDTTVARRRAGATLGN